MSALTSLSAIEMRQGLLSGDFSSVELSKAHLERAIANQERTNDFINIFEESILKEAAQADRVISEQADRSPRLTGIPLAIKDIILTEGTRTTCASKMLENFVAPYSATAWARLNKAGGLLLGKTNQDEFGMGTASKNSFFGPVLNPWDSERVPGGSSGGSAAAVSAGHAPIGLASDTGGSIRQPAAYCGVYGLKPTYGRVSRYGVIAFASSLDQLGPHTRTLEDMALCMEVIAGHDPLDSTSSGEPVDDYLTNLQSFDEDSLKGLKIGLPRQYFVEHLSPEAKETVDQVAKGLSGLGVEVVEVDLPHTPYALPTYYIIAPAEASSNLARYDGVRYGFRAEGISSLSEMYEKTRSEGFGDEVKRRIMIGTFVLSAGYYDAYYNKAQKVRTLVTQDFKEAFQNNCDIILAPTTLSDAFRSDEKNLSPLEMYLEDLFTTSANLAGIPGLSVPVRKSKDQLPLGVQLLGPHFSESKLLCVAKAIENLSEFDTREKTHGSL